ncbi:MAG: hypothetical protein E7F17_03890 [Clostridium perfringens]|nr:hypothetical protein [Clostridium perfringens]EGT0694099.1 hypothetical protein [Clostridium perfringens]MDU3376310.1 hypothetical protein [Clostridium perfringens]MDU3535952.1 hypothetical protein [Clostridium perfringens]
MNILMEILNQITNVLSKNPSAIVGLYILLSIIMLIYSSINLKDGTFINLIVAAVLITIPIVTFTLSLAIDFNVFNADISNNWFYLRDRWINVLNNVNTIACQIIILITILGREFMVKIIKDFKLTQYSNYNFISIATKSMLEFVFGATSLIFLNIIIWGNEIQVIILIAILCLCIRDIVDVFDKCNNTKKLDFKRTH